MVIIIQQLQSLNNIIKKKTVNQTLINSSRRLMDKGTYKLVRILPFYSAILTF